MNGFRGYDAWKLMGPDEDRHEVGMNDGEICGRYHEPEEDAPRGSRPRPCNGTMCLVDAGERDDGSIVYIAVCDTCEETGND